LLIAIFLHNIRFAFVQRHTLVVRKQGLSMTKKLRSGTLEEFGAPVVVTQGNFLGARGQ
jgi:hypothetical protein